MPHVVHMLLVELDHDPWLQEGFVAMHQVVVFGDGTILSRVLMMGLSFLLFFRSTGFVWEALEYVTHEWW